MNFEAVYENNLFSVIFKLMKKNLLRTSQEIEWNPNCRFDENYMCELQIPSYSSLLDYKPYIASEEDQKKTKNTAVGSKVMEKKKESSALVNNKEVPLMYSSISFPESIVLPDTVHLSVKYSL